jgi:hypothetical protein
MYKYLIIIAAAPILTIVLSLVFPELGTPWINLFPVFLVILWFSLTHKKKKPPSVNIPTKKEMWKKHY